MSVGNLDGDTILDIETSILDRGRLSREEILQGWQLDGELFPALKAILISRKQARVQRGFDGLVARPRRAALPQDPTTGPCLRELWELSAVARLATLFTHETLEKLLGPLTHTVRQARLARDGVDRRGTKEELAAALVIRHSIDLLVDGDMRRAFARACQIDPPLRWVPGKTAAIDFTAAIGMPREFAGLPHGEKPPSFEYLEGRFMLKPLEDFQREVRDALLSGFSRHGFRTIVALPTGAGKTRVAVDAIRDHLTSSYAPDQARPARRAVLWLAHTEELCEQACACFRQVWDASEQVAPLHLVRFWGGYLRDLESHLPALRQFLERTSVLVSTPQRVMTLLNNDLPAARETVADLQRSLCLLLIDEAHRAAAPTYQHVLESLVGGKAEIPVVGLTATPFRREYIIEDPEAGTADLYHIFKTLSEPRKTLGEKPHAELQRRGILAQPSFETIQTHVAMQMPAIAAALPTEEDVGRIDRVLALRADITRRRLVILKHIAPIALDSECSMLYFGPSVGDAECMAYLLREQGIPAGVVSGETRESTRRLLIGRFKRREIRVLCNCEVLTTGFDAPLVSHVVMARPTVSQVLYEQMVGRGLRGLRFGGTGTCVILDCADDYGGPTRPELGYARFRRIWERGVRRDTGTPLNNDRHG